MLERLILKLNSKVIAFDLRSLALFRILLGCALLYNLVFYRFPAVGVYYNNPNLISESSTDAYYGPAVPLFLWSDSDTWYYILLSAILILSFSFIIGFKTKWITPVLFILYGSLITTNPYLSHAVEFLEEAALFWSMFLPLGACFTFFKSDKIKFTGVQRIAHLGLQFQLFLIYISSWIFKDGELWQSGKVLEVVSKDLIHARPILKLLGEYPQIAQIFTYAGFYLEVIVSLLVLLSIFSKRTRLWTSLSIVILHGIMAIFLHVGTFFIIGFGFASLFLTTAIWERLKMKGVFIDSMGTSKKLPWQHKVYVVFILFTMLFILRSNLYQWSNKSYAAPLLTKLPFHKEVINRQLRDPGIFTGFWHQSWKFFPNNLYGNYGDFIFIGYDENGVPRELRTHQILQIEDRGNSITIDPLPSHSYFGDDFTFAVYYKFYQDRFPDQTKKAFLQLYIDKYHNSTDHSRIVKAELWKLIRTCQFQGDQLIVNDSLSKQETIIRSNSGWISL